MTEQNVAPVPPVRRAGSPGWLTDYNISHNWSPDDPEWLKSLVSSLYRRRGAAAGAVLPLAVIVAEIAEWLELASGIEA